MCTLNVGLRGVNMPGLLLFAGALHMQSLPTLPAVQQSRYLLSQVVHSDGSINAKEQKSR